jgi:BirA family biotin operon repressor/biotin-[acetyl-CoA-carboxylase] ligase
LKSNLPDLGDSHTIPADVREALDRVSSRAGAIGARLHWLASTGSTNDVAARLADVGAEEGTVVIAESQTSGRGRLGRTWYSPPSAGLYVSIVLRPATPRISSSDANPATLLTLACGVAITEAVRLTTGLPAEIKWPNDVIIQGRKLAGILAEAASEAGALQYVVLGFGVNIHTAAYPAELADRVTSIDTEMGRSVDRALLLAEILAAIAERYAELRAGKFDVILSAWRRLAPSLPGSPVEWDLPHGVVQGRAQGIDDDGALLVRVDGRLERVIAGEIRWV